MSLETAPDICETNWMERWNNVTGLAAPKPALNLLSAAFVWKGYFNDVEQVKPKCRHCKQISNNKYKIM